MKTHQLVPDRQRERSQLQPHVTSFDSLHRGRNYTSLSIANSSADLQGTVKVSERAGLGVIGKASR